MPAIPSTAASASASEISGSSSSSDIATSSAGGWATTTPVDRAKPQWVEATVATVSGSSARSVMGSELSRW